MTDLSGLLDDARAVFPETVELRRAIHRTPEIGLHLPVTQATVLDAITGLGLAVRTGAEVSSVVAVLDGGRPGPTVLLRGDMDALPLREDTGLAFASTVDGAMHACGHDTHVAMLAGAARLLAGRRAELAGRVLLMFQPGEEGYHGARHMLAEGLLEAAGGPVTAAFALHITTQHASGTVNVRGGPQLAAADVLRLTLTGRGGHASQPYSANDPIPVACEIVTALQTMVTRRVSVLDPAVVTIAQVRAGTTNNIIPETAYLEGTVRTLSDQTRAEVHGHIRRLAEGIAAAHEMTVKVDIEVGYPVTRNDPAFAAAVRAIAAEVLGDGAVTEPTAPVMGAEDFSYVLARVPGAIAFLGGCPPDLIPGVAPPNHSNRVVFDDDAMVAGVATYAAVALHHLTPA
ncbi:MAG TPA: M20 family metallopeptidase [Mycobacteriales bacterium]|nr:M20 family metallopeptidase [Mycobacteriales bacterium]